MKEEQEIEEEFNEIRESKGIGYMVVFPTSKAREKSTAHLSSQMTEFLRYSFSEIVIIFQRSGSHFMYECLLAVRLVPEVMLWAITEYNEKVLGKL